MLTARIERICADNPLGGLTMDRDGFQSAMADWC